MTDNKVVAVLSGGIDSAVVMWWALEQGCDTLAVSVDYGQRNRRELGYASDLCAQVNVRHETVDLSSLKKLLKGNALTDDIDVPEGHYTSPNMKQAVVPNRNMVLLSVAICAAASEGASRVLYGAHKGSTIYPDTRPEFVERISLAAEVCWFNPVFIEAPFIDKTKAEIVLLGTQIGVPWEHTWSCYNGEEIHCGLCGTCVERREAFQLAEVKDPTNYLDQTPILELVEKITNGNQEEV
jgi:7-cyano-7-deazaguanine synthase